MKFIGREQEQKTIQRLMSKEGYQGCVIYGRRRMGKTELVRKCVLEKSTVVMYQCKESNEQDNVEMLTACYVRFSITLTCLLLLSWTR